MDQIFGFLWVFSGPVGVVFIAWGFWRTVAFTALRGVNKAAGGDVSGAEWAKKNQYRGIWIWVVGVVSLIYFSLGFYMDYIISYTKPLFT